MRHKNTHLGGANGTINWSRWLKENTADAFSFCKPVPFSDTEISKVITEIKNTNRIHIVAIFFSDLEKYIIILTFIPNNEKKKITFEYISWILQQSPRMENNYPNFYSQISLWLRIKEKYRLRMKFDC